MLIPLPRTASADEPGALSAARWKNLSEIEFAELKAAEDVFRKKASFTAARNSYEKFMNAHSKSDVATYCQLMMAECLRLQGKPNLAVSDFQFVRDIAPDSDDAKWAYLRIGQCYRQSGDVEKAIVIYKDLFKNNGTHPTAFHAALEHVAILEGQKKLRERVPVWEEFIDRFNKNRLDGDRYREAAEGLAREKLLAGDVPGAYILYRSVRQESDAQRMFVGNGESVIYDLNTKELAARRDKVAELLSNTVMGWLHENKDRPYHEDLTRGVVNIFQTIGNTDEAVKQALEARKLYSNAPWTYGLMVELYKRANKIDKAIGVASEARQFHKDADWAIDMYATLVREKGDIEQAVAAWDLMKNRKFSLERTSEVLRQAGKLNDAITRRRKISELDSHESTNVFMWVGNALAWSGKNDEAIKEFRQAQNEPANLYRVAECLSAQKKYKEAIAQYSEIGAAFETDTPHAIYCMALEYEKLNDNDTAIKLLRKVNHLFPKSGAASEAHVRLKTVHHFDDTLGGATEGEKN